MCFVQFLIHHIMISMRDRTMSGIYFFLATVNPAPIILPAHGKPSKDKCFINVWVEENKSDIQNMKQLLW